MSSSTQQTHVTETIGTCIDSPIALQMEENEDFFLTEIQLYLYSERIFFRF